MRLAELASAVIAECNERGLTLGTAESLTGGLACANLTAVPGASAVVRGAVVAYSDAVKRQLLGVRAEVLAADGAVSAEVALEMATGARRALQVDLALATTGEAGPASGSGAPVGRVFVGVDARGQRYVRRLTLGGGREEIRTATVEAAFRLLIESLPPS